MPDRSQISAAAGHTPRFAGKEPHRHAAGERGGHAAGERGVKRGRQRLAPAAQRAPAGTEIARNKDKIKHKARGWRLLPHRRQLRRRGGTAARRGAAPRCGEAESPGPGSAEVPAWCRWRGTEGQHRGGGEYPARKVRGWGGGADREDPAGCRRPRVAGGTVAEQDPPLTLPSEPLAGTHPSLSCLAHRLGLERLPAQSTHAAGGENHQRHGAPAQHRHPGLRTWCRPPRDQGRCQRVLVPSSIRMQPRPRGRSQRAEEAGAAAERPDGTPLGRGQPASRPPHRRAPAPRQHRSPPGDMRDPPSHGKLGPSRAAVSTPPASHCPNCSRSEGGTWEQPPWAPGTAPSVPPTGRHPGAARPLGYGSQDSGAAVASASSGCAQELLRPVPGRGWGRHLWQHREDGMGTDSGVQRYRERCTGINGGMQRYWG
ncbi:PREDICTED: trithorax group protein osa-like [Nipponia nippon]|uniref:trithorax group protein osa-like n=1 Tax=Nipponia nippon TaxID=128390 RepID=UPI000510D093|nr:PREDICTED: trithorax group protein osa-like [Nipponia nippon]